MVHKIRLCFLILIQLCIPLSAIAESENLDKTGLGKGTCSSDGNDCPVNMEKDDSAMNQENLDDGQAIPQDSKDTSQTSNDIQETASDLVAETDDSFTDFAHLNESIHKRVDILNDEVKGNISAIEKKVLSNRSEMIEKMNELSQQNSQNFTSVNEAIEINQNNLNELEANFQEKIKKINDNIAAMQQKEVKNKDSLNELTSQFKRLNEELNSIREDLKKDLQDEIEKNEKLLIDTKNELITSIERSHSDFNLVLNELRSAHEDEFKKIREKQTKDKYELAVNIKEDRSDLENEIETAKTKLGSDINEAKQHMQQLLKNTKNSLEEKNKSMEDKMANVITDMERKAEQMSETLKSTEERLKKKVNETETEMMSNIKLAKDDFNKHIQAIMATFKQETNIIIETLHKQQGLVDLIYPNTFNKEMVMKVGGFIIIVVVLNICCTFALIHRIGLSHSRGAWENGPRQNSSINKPSSVLERVPSQPELENEICIVFFDEDRLELIKSILKPVLRRDRNSEDRTTELPVTTHLIHCHENIVNIPPCQLTVMCVDFTERNVIIEQQGIGLGDLKKTTHLAIQKLGSSEVILYLMDPGSKSLGEGHLYNRDIYCVTSQPELIPLEREGHFFSVFDHLTRYQQKKFRNVIMDSGISYP